MYLKVSVYVLEGRSGREEVGWLPICW